MSWLFWISASLAGAIHVLIFCLESVGFRRPAVHRRFGVRGELPETTRLFAFNQGFYNLFLAVGTGIGLGLIPSGHREWGLLLVAWNMVIMVGAALVLVASSPRLWRGAAIQGAPAAVTVLAAACLAWGH